jgi:hypothetical protein
MMCGTRTNDPSVIAATSFLRGLPIAALQACGVVAIQRYGLVAVAASAFAINWYWFTNVRAVDGTNRICFAAGAACGSVLTVWLLR